MIIGVSGKKRSGKDTFFRIAQKRLMGLYSVKRYAFADPVKEYAQDYFGILPENVKDEENRFILQGIGHIMREEVTKDYWINKIIRQVYQSQLKDPNEISIITDVRYRNEADAILEQEHGLLVRVVNKNTEAPDSHFSEIDLDDYEFDFTIHNNGTLEEYEKEVVGWIESNLPWITR